MLGARGKATEQTVIFVAKIVAKDKIMSKISPFDAYENEIIKDNKHLNQREVTQFQRSVRLGSSSSLLQNRERAVLLYFLFYFDVKSQIPIRTIFLCFDQFSCLNGFLM